MTPLHIQMMLHYAGSVDAWRGIGNELHDEYLGWLCKEGLLCSSGTNAVYAVTDKGCAYVAMLKETPIPVQAYIDPRSGKEVE